MSIPLVHGQAYEMILRVESLPLTMTDEHLQNALTDAGFSDVSLWRVGSSMPPLLAQASREMVATFPEWLTYARGTWDAPSGDQQEDLGEATLFRVRSIAPQSAPAPRTALAIAGGLTLSALVITGIAIAVRDARKKRRLSA